MVGQNKLAPGDKVEMGVAGTPSFREGLVLGSGSAEMLGRHEEQSSVLVAWTSGEQEWIELNLLRPRA